MRVSHLFREGVVYGGALLLRDSRYVSKYFCANSLNNIIFKAYILVDDMSKALEPKFMKTVL